MTAQTSATEDDWKATPAEQSTVAVMTDGTRREYKDLKPGDVFQALAVEPGKIVDPLYRDFDEHPDMWAVCIGEPVKGFAGKNGYAVALETGSLEEVTARAKELAN